MTHGEEDTFHDSVVGWFKRIFGHQNVHENVYQPEPYWFVDLVVDLPFCRFYIEIENDADSIRPGIAQAQAYAAAEPVSGVPMVVTPKGHLEDAARLRASTPAIIREFDAEAGEWV